ncbi:MAG: gliding motility-associated C-terminal domain-containing protein [Bacteroidia bacterium]|nr:gliding motility-associated C-terminal domain-containing protein [Bacteroidia bacterium]NNJ56162.1 hypothetical protein [Bacteroidia bacterium]
MTLSVRGQNGFVENQGQWSNQFDYLAEFNTQTIFLNKAGFSVLLHDNQKWAMWIEEMHDHGHSDASHKHKNTEKELDFHHIQFAFVGANLTNPKPTETNSEHYNYFVGKDASKWVSNVKKHSTLVYEDVYPNIDLEFQILDQRFKYNFILNPGSKIEDIQIDIQGDDGVKVKKDRLEVTSRFGSFSEIMPISYTLTNGTRNAIPMHYVERNGYIGFETDKAITGTYTVIDPELIFSTYSGSSVDNFGFTATFDSSGNLYAGGIATRPGFGLSGRYPATIGAFSVSFNGGSGFEPANLPCDISISKYDSSGANLLYATYLGGESDEYPHSLIVDENNNLIVFGSSYSTTYPTTPGAPYPLNRGGTDIVVTKFNSTGSALIGSTYIGGTLNDGLNENSYTRYFYADDFRGEVNLDQDGNIYVATSTVSDNFPTSAGAFQTTSWGAQEGVVFSLNPTLNTVRWCSYFGGLAHDAIYSIDVAETGDLYISGGSNSANLQKTVGSVGESFNGGRTDGFLAQISNNGATLKKTAYWGTSGYDQILSLDIDKSGDIFVVGHSDNDMLVSGNVYSNTGGSQFISKFSPNLDNILLSTVFGSGGTLPDITINAFLVDECGKIFVSGWGSNSETATRRRLSNMPITYDALQKTTDGQDFYLAVFRKDAQELLYGTYFGGNRSGDHVDGGTSRFDKRGVIYQSVCSSCPEPEFPNPNNDFPVSDGAYSETNPSPRCSNASFKIAFGNLNRKPELKEELFEVTALDTLNFFYTITDPDDDTINVFFTYQDEIKESFIDRKSVYMDQTKVDAEFAVSPGCEHVGDTFTVQAYALDRGCPGFKDSLSNFKIVVNPPPVLDPPQVICLNFLNKDAIRIEWEALVPSKYFYRMYLYKTWPNGTTVIVDTFYTQGIGSYTDVDVINPRERNYTYHLVVENLCNELGSKSYDLSSIKEHEIPVEATYLKTVTVEGDHLKIVWLKSKEADFGHYELYKGVRGKLPLTYITSFENLNDTIFVDEDVDINNVSYCYEIRVSDDCGHLSKLSNIGCSMVIKGISLNNEDEVPRFKFDLDWDEYVLWAGSVKEYELIRSVDTGSLRPIVRVNHPTIDYRDSDLDYDWGGYWYSVVAYEGDGGYNATSRSNDIYLIQPPLVFVPNAFTPHNIDNINDNFGWSDVFVRDFEMRIFNRWGEKVYQSTDKNDTWSGDSKNTGLKESGVFVWIVTYKGWDDKRYIKKGTVTLLR